MKEIKTNCGIYEIRNVFNNNCYIGSSSNLKSRKNQHFNNLKNNKHSNTHLQNSYNLKGDENFEWRIIKYIEKCAELKEELLKWEQYYIDDYKNSSIELYNIRDIAESNLGIKFGSQSKEHRNKISTANKGKKLSIETKEKLSVQAKIRLSIKENHPYYGKVGPNKGKKYSKEHKERMSASRMGFAPSEKSRGRMSASRKNSDLCKIQMENLHSGHNKKVINLDTNKVFESLTAASKFYSIKLACISKTCKGHQKTAGGYRWRYFF